MATLSNTRTLRIEWGDCDPAGIVFYPRYFAIFDASTTKLFERALGLTKYQFLKHYAFAGYPMVDTRARFLKPTRFGDDVVIETSIKFGRASFNVEHKLSLNGELAVECSEKRVWVVRDPADPSRIQSEAIPDEVIAKFNA
ncbi:MAG TPA: acyl-CoA thioesterase [Pseudolabrys sp.]|nr:acyl-CoA thioesterase [Pseudolabrys sp.]